MLLLPFLLSHLHYFHTRHVLSPNLEKKKDKLIKIRAELGQKKSTTMVNLSENNNTRKGLH